MTHPANRDVVGVYGKIPAQGDFVRINASDPAAQSLDGWIQESLDAVARSGAELPPEPVYFIHQGAGHGALIGVMLRSADRVGRVYPLTVFARVDPSTLGGAFSGFPTAYSLFLQDASRLAHELDRADAAHLAARARSLRVPSHAEVTQAAMVCQHVLNVTPAGELTRRLFSDAIPGSHVYAFKTVVDACDTTRARPPRVPITLDCPIASDVDLFAWLELCRRRLAGVALLPTCVWRELGASRLLISLGAAQGAMLRYLAQPEAQATQLWPLVTSRADAVEAAHHNLAPHHRQALESPAASLEALLSTLAV